MKRGASKSVADLEGQSSPKRISPITYDEFLESCNMGNLDEVKHAIECLTPEIIASNENKAFRFAASNGHLAVVNRLLEIEAVSDNATALHNEALCGASLNGRINVVYRLLEIAAVRDSAAEFGSLALRVAAFKGHIDVVNCLLKIDAVRNAAAVKNNAAFRWAAADGRLAVVNRLLEIEAVSNNATAEDNEALRRAAAEGHLAVVRRLLNEDNVRALAISELKLNFSDKNSDQQINILIGRLAEINPKLMKSFRNSEAQTLCFAYRSLNKQPNALLRKPPIEVVRLIARMVQASLPPPAPQLDDSSSKKQKL